MTKWLLVLVQLYWLIVSPNLSSGRIISGERFMLHTTFKGNTTALVTFQAPAAFQLQSMELLGSSGNCRQFQVPTCHVILASDIPALATLTYYVNQDTPIGDYTIRIEVNDLNTGELRVINQLVRIGTIPQGDPQDPKTRLYFPAFYH